MNTKFKLMTYNDILYYIPEIVKYDVSKRARENDGFLSIFLKVKGDKNELNKSIYPNTNRNYLEERELFLKRHLAKFKTDPTIRRKLAIIAWAYLP